MSDTAVAAAPKQAKEAVKPADTKAPAPATPEQTVTAALKDMPRSVRPLPEPRIFCAHASMGKIGNIWIATLPAGMPFEDCLADEFWANKAKDMHAGDTIEVKTDDQAFAAKLEVTGTRTVGAGNTANRISVSKREYALLTPPSNYVDVGDHEVVFAGPHLKWCLKRRSDGKFVNEGFEDKESAERARRSVMAAKTR
jgi:hypothetical protein